MICKQLQHGFSLVEVLMAAGILAVGLVMIAGTFPVAIFMTAASVEQTIAPIVADEAFAKIQLYGIQKTGTYGLPAFTAAVKCEDFNNINTVKTASANMNGDEYLYPSASSVLDKVYNWSAICQRLADSNDALVQVTVFVSRKTGNGLRYPDLSGAAAYDWPTPVPIDTGLSGSKLTTSQMAFVTDGCAIMADDTGNIYRVLDHDAAGITLDRDWIDSTGAKSAWIVPPPTSGGRSPCIGVYQRIIKF